MKTEYQYLLFKEAPFKGKTKKFSCLTKNGGVELGIIKWYPGWRQYCYFPIVQAVYSKGCLSDIKDFINQLK